MQDKGLGVNFHHIDGNPSNNAIHNGILILDKQGFKSAEYHAPLCSPNVCNKKLPSRPRTVKPLNSLEALKKVSWVRGRTCEYMNPEQAKARTRALLNVIEAVYELKIVNLNEIIKTVTEKTLDENKILTICTGLNTWVALNAALGGLVEIPQEVLNELAEKIL